MCEMLHILFFYVIGNSSGIFLLHKTLRVGCTHCAEEGCYRDCTMAREKYIRRKGMIGDEI